MNVHIMCCLYAYKFVRIMQVLHIRIYIMHEYIHTYIRTYMCVCVCMCVCACVFVCVCVCVSSE